MYRCDTTIYLMYSIVIHQQKGYMICAGDADEAEVW